MRLPALLLTVAPLLALLAACGDDSSPAETPESNQPVVSATPYDVTPTPIIVTGSGSSSGVAGGQEISYTVESGDTLLALATRFDTTVEAIMRRNDLASASDLNIGQQLIIPRGTSSVASPAATTAATARAGNSSSGRTYQVQNGDLAGSIAAQFGITLDELAEANNRTVESLDQLTVGEELVIPSP
jgi:lysozyme